MIRLNPALAEYCCDDGRVVPLSTLFSYRKVAGELNS